MTTPKRIQRLRTKDWRMPPNTVYVGRPGKFGNIIRIPNNNHLSVEWFKRWLNGDITARQYTELWLAGALAIRATDGVPLANFYGHRRTQILHDLHELSGKNQACWCSLCPDHADGKPLDIKCKNCAPCHADVLGELANRLTHVCGGNRA